MKNFDKWFLIITISVAILLFIGWAIWLGISLQEVSEALNERH